MRTDYITAYTKPLTHMTANDKVHFGCIIPYEIEFKTSLPTRKECIEYAAKKAKDKMFFKYLTNLIYNFPQNESIREMNYQKLICACEYIDYLSAYNRYRMYQIGLENLRKLTEISFDRFKITEDENMRKKWIHGSWDIDENK